MTALAWQVTLADTLVEQGVTSAVYVPDSRLHGILLRLEARAVTMRSLTREEECVAYAAGQRLAGARPVVLLQSSGIGNSLNALGSLVLPYRLGIPMIVSIRGGLGEANPSQVLLGHATRALLAALGIEAFALSQPEHTEQITTGVCTLAYASSASAAVLLEPQLGGRA